MPGGRGSIWVQAENRNKNREVDRTRNSGQSRFPLHPNANIAQPTHVNSNLGPLSVLSDAFPVVWRDGRRPDLGISVDPGVEVGRGCELLGDVDLSGEGGEDFEVIHEGVLVGCVRRVIRR
jgi:hypothetical protein